MKQANGIPFYCKLYKSLSPTKEKENPTKKLLNKGKTKAKYRREKKTVSNHRRITPHISLKMIFFVYKMQNNRVIVTRAIRTKKKNRQTTT